MSNSIDDIPDYTFGRRGPDRNIPAHIKSKLEIEARAAARRVGKGQADSWCIRVRGPKGYEGQSVKEALDAVPPRYCYPNGRGERVEVAVCLNTGGELQYTGLTAGGLVIGRQEATLDDIHDGINYAPDHNPRADMPYRVYLTTKP